MVVVSFELGLIRTVCIMMRPRCVPHATWYVSSKPKRWTSIAEEGTLPHVWSWVYTKVFKCWCHSIDQWDQNILWPYWFSMTYVCIVRAVTCLAIDFLLLFWVFLCLFILLFKRVCVCVRAFDYIILSEFVEAVCVAMMHTQWYDGLYTCIRLGLEQCEEGHSTNSDRLQLRPWI